jgi:hypothetical protein
MKWLLKLYLKIVSCFIVIILWQLFKIPSCVYMKGKFVSDVSLATVRLINHSLDIIKCLAPFLVGVRVSRSLVFSVMICRTLLFLFLLAIVLSVLQFTLIDYPFRYIFKLFFRSNFLSSSFKFTVHSFLRLLFFFVPSSLNVFKPEAVFWSKQLLSNHTF